MNVCVYEWQDDPRVVWTGTSGRARNVQTGTRVHGEERASQRGMVWQLPNAVHRLMRVRTQTVEKE
jgi:hypothetical protein